jgi:hypothetical protein
VSLSAHLTSDTAAHGRLAFHPNCPRCRTERLAGSLGADALMSRRAQAALAAGLLAFSAAAPPALAQGGEVDQEQEGMADPGGGAPKPSSSSLTSTRAATTHSTSTPSRRQASLAPAVRRTTAWAHR